MRQGGGKILIGIPTHRRPELLRECLESIARQVGQLPDVEVFVADNNPAGREGIAAVDALKASYRFPISAETVPTPGISAVRNAILAEARRRNVDFIAMIDDDETASTEWLVNLLTMQRSTSADVVGGPVRYGFAAPPGPGVIESKAFRRAAKAPGRTPPLRGSGNFLVSARSLEGAGWPTFDADFGLSGGGDTEWFLRVAKLGFRFAWAPDAVATEEVPPERTTEEWILMRAYRAGNSNMRIAIRQWPSTGIVLNLGQMVLAAFALLLAPLLLVPRHRLRLLGEWYAAAGRAAAILGRDTREYGVRHKTEVTRRSA